jgi:phosphatidylinositol glycan class S
MSSLTPVFSVFRSQLRTLLGVPAIPPSISVSNFSPSNVPPLHPNERVSHHRLSPWQKDALLRTRTLENVNGARETLESIVKLVHQIQNMPVKANVRGDVVGALDALRRLCPFIPSLANSRSCLSHKDLSLEEALLHSSEAYTKASRAFFSPDMLAMLYFPTEHIFAVYTPLFLPVAVPLLVLTLREFAAWRRQRRGAGVLAAVRISPVAGLIASAKLFLSGMRRKEKTE